MQQISIKEEVNSDGEDSKNSHKFSLNDLGFIKCEGGAGSQHVKKELRAFDGPPKTLHIQPLPDELAQDFFEETAKVDEAAKSRLDFVPNLNRVKNFTCALCAKKIGTRGGLLYHVKTHFKGRPFKCDICNRSYATKNDFQTHYKRHAGDRFTCDFCSKNFVVKDYLMIHVRANHLPKVLPCTDCKVTKYFSCKAELKRHYSTNRRKLLKKINARFQCKLCKMRFIQLKAYTKHCQDRELLNFKCATCLKKFACYKLLVDHVDAEKKANFCELCKINVKSLKVHMDNFHRKHICSFCGKFETMILSQFTEHQKTCATEDQVQALGHVCTICDQHFRYDISLKRHMNKTHVGNFWCVKCSKSYHSIDALKTHLLYHKRKKRGQKQCVHYKCISCEPPRNFYIQYSFDRHFQSSHGVGEKRIGLNFACEKCKRRYGSKAILKQHITKCIVSKNLLPRSFTVRQTRARNYIND